MGKYTCDEEFMSDAVLIFENCNTYNDSDADVYRFVKRIYPCILFDLYDQISFKINNICKQINLRKSISSRNFLIAKDLVRGKLCYLNLMFILCFVIIFTCTTYRCGVRLLKVFEKKSKELGLKLPEEMQGDDNEAKERQNKKRRVK